MRRITDISQLDFNKQYTDSDYLTWQFTERVELIKGWIYKMSPAPRRRHQKISSKISNEFFTFLKGRTCEIYTAPFDVRLIKDKGKNSEIETVVQPDISIICDKSKLDERGCVGSPDLVIEILSLSTSKKDYGVKFDLYEENGVKEYWIVNPELNSIEIYSLENQKYILFKEFIEKEEDQKIQGKLFPNLSLDIKDIFEE